MNGKVTIGGRDFSVPEFSIRQQRIVTPLLMSAAGVTGDLSNAEEFGRVLDCVYDCLTVKDRAGNPINDISKDDFEDLRCGPLHIATVVLPALMTQAGLKQPGDPSTEGGAGQAAPDTPLPGGTTSTT